MVVEPEAWLPDPIERCQDGLRRAWETSGQGECWYLDRSALERFFQEDTAATDLPESWRRLLAVANLPPDALADLPNWMRFTAADFAVLQDWSRELGGRLDPNPATESPELAWAPVEPRSNLRFALLACLALAVVLGGFAAMSYRDKGLEAVGRRSAEDRLAVAETELHRRETEVQERKLAQAELTTRLGAARQQNALLSSKLDQIRISAKPEVPGIDLRALTIARAAGPTSAWERRSPTYTALRQPPAELTWPKGPSMPARVLVFDAATHVRILSRTVNLADGRVALSGTLALGHAYLWSVVTDSGEEGFSATPFYVLSPAERTRLDASLRQAPSDTDRAALVAKFGLYDELGAIGSLAKRRLALQ